MGMEHAPALSIRQPWAELIVRGEKAIELRSWQTGYRGPLWVHAGSTRNRDLEAAFHLSNLVYGGYIGLVIVKAIVPMDPERWKLWRSRHRSPEAYQPGLYAWVLSAPQRFARPIPGPGQLNLFTPPPEVENLLYESAEALVSVG